MKKGIQQLTFILPVSESKSQSISEKKYEDITGR